MGEIRRQFYVSQLASKQAELAAIQDDLETCQSKKQELKLKKNAEQLLKDIEELECQLSNADMGSNKLIVKSRVLDQKLRKIDFLAARRIASELKESFEAQEGGSALLLLQRTTKQMGYNCLHEMLSTIFGYEMPEEVLQGRQDGTCKVYESNLASVATGGSELECLRQLFRYEGKPALCDDVDGLGQEFRKSFCESRRSGDRVLILVKDWHYVEPRSFLKWFIEGFWKPLIDEIKHCVLPEHGFIKVVAVLASGSQVHTDCLSEISLCSLDSLNSHHMIDIPLPDWTVEDIQNWLMGEQQLGRTESLRCAQRLHADSDGTPHIVCSMLRDRYSA